MGLNKVEKKGIKPLVKRLARKILSCANQFVPKDEHLVFFCVTSRPRMEDNTEALFTYMKEHGYERDYRLVSFVLRFDNRWRDGYYNYVGLLRACLVNLRAKYCFYCVGSLGISPSRNQVVVNQWHGFPFKRVGAFLDSSIMPAQAPFTYVLAASESYADVMAEAFACSRGQVLVAGRARNDYLFSEANALGRLFGDVGEYRKKVIWMPTFRKSIDGMYDDGAMTGNETGVPLLRTRDDLIRFNELLVKRGLLLILKPHPFTCLEGVQSLSNVAIVYNEDLYEAGVKLYELLSECDALITDYSSVPFDYLVLDRPIGYTIDDYEEYAAKRGFVFDDPLSFMPGPKLRTLEDLLAFFDGLMAGEDDWQAERRRVLGLVDANPTYGYSKRLLDAVGIRPPQEKDAR